MMTGRFGAFELPLPVSQKKLPPPPPAPLPCLVPLRLDPALRPPWLASLTALDLRAWRPRPCNSAMEAARLCAALPALTCLHLHLRLRPRPRPAPRSCPGSRVVGAEALGEGAGAEGVTGLVHKQGCGEGSGEPGGAVATTADEVAKAEAEAESALLKAAGPQLLALELILDLDSSMSYLDVNAGFGAALPAVVELLSGCASLRGLQLRLVAGGGDEAQGEGKWDEAGASELAESPQRSQGHANCGGSGRSSNNRGSSGSAGTPLAVVQASTSAFASAATGPQQAALESPALAQLAAALSSLTSLRSLELAGPLLPADLLPQLEVHPAALQTLTGLVHLTRLVLPFQLAAGTAAAASTAASATAAAPGAALPSLYGLTAKRWHVLYGAAVCSLLDLQPQQIQIPIQRASHTVHSHATLPPPAPPPAPPFAQHLLDLDLGHDLALTLPYLPYAATALTRLCVGELSCECVAAGQWDLVPESPPPLPDALLAGLPAWAWEPAVAGQPGAGGGRPRCALPLAAVRVPPRLRCLRVRFLPDVAVLAALAALPCLSRLECTAIQHPHGEICLDFAAIGLRGPPDLTMSARRSFRGDDGRAATAVAAHEPASIGRPDAAVSAASGGISPRAPAEELRVMVNAAARLLLRLLAEADWSRHPLTLRPSPFAFLRPGYEALRWAGPHAEWLEGLAPLAGKASRWGANFPRAHCIGPLARPQVRRLRLKQMVVGLADLEALRQALPGLQAVELHRCAAGRGALRRAAALLGPGVLDASGADAAPGGPEDCEDMFGDSDSDEDGGGERGPTG
ncbi:hypothetical protein GPECTOR_4g673 [Gonium pectorale]|uniref:Uncharacterized protein n=1 Tax=Gonium pectorale TaxID=33097 RepID=A0A150GY49_GONPE|nr:hypothetical protein GPECTOR_4g673 [Gonium pectorale]|eukprot:KXZ54608.1 hypothetical protein GPECTOR_4g673 [Gonium pectorale]